MEKVSGVARAGEVVPKSVKPNPPLLVRRDSWRKPRGLVATTGAFGRKGKVGQVSDRPGRNWREEGVHQVGKVQKGGRPEKAGNTRLG